MPFPVRTFARLFSATLLFTSIAQAQVSRVAPRVSGPVDESSLSRLRGNVSAVAQPQFDRGEAAPETGLSRVRIVFARSAEQNEELDRLERDLQNKSSPLYHKWLTPQQFGERFGPADSDVAAVVAWLESHGLTVQGLDPGRTGIAFSGTVRQIEGALHTSIHSYAINGRQFFANNADPEIPSALAGVIAGVAHLNTIHPQPLAARGKNGWLNPATGRLESLASTLGGAPTPEYSDQSGNLWIDPADAATIYDAPNATFNPNYTEGTSYDGRGVTIGIISAALVKTSIVQNYRKRFLGNSTAPVITNVNGMPASNTSLEAYLDAEVAGALAPGATIHVYADDDLAAAIERALTDNTADILSVSYEECEQDLTTAENAQFENYWQQAAAQGIPVLVGAGDAGSAGCDPFNVNGQVNPEAKYGMKVNGFASTPYDIAVGGTDFAGLKTNSAAYLSPDNLGKFYRSALGYIPESTWNDSTQSNATLSGNVPWSVGLNPYQDQITAGGGGPSNCSTNKTQNSIGACVSGYPKPAWQRGSGVPADNARDLPDVSLMAGNGIDRALWLVCDETNNGGTSLDDCSTQSGGYFAFEGVGGTSASTPAWAGILALVQQSSGGRLGQAAQQLYDLFNGSHASQIFHDITVGNISVACNSGTPNCAKDASGYYYESGYNSGPGYDLATGLGSVDAAQLVAYWATATGAASATVTVTPAATSISADQTLPVTVTVAASGSTGAPTGTVTLSSGTYTSAPTALSGGSAAFSIPASTLAPGSDTLTATYSGDPTYASASGTAGVTVIAVVPAAFTIAATSPAAIAPGATASSTVTVTGTGGYAGTITFSCALTSAPAGAANVPTCAAGSPVTLGATASSASSTAVVNTAAPAAAILKIPVAARWFSTMVGGTAFGVLILFFPGRLRRWRKEMIAVIIISVAGFNTIGCGSSSSASSTAQGGGGASSKATPTVTVTPSGASAAANVPLPVIVAVTGSGSAAPSGNVTLASGMYTSSATTLASGQASITIPANTLPVGTDMLAATYSGDGNYNASTGNATVTITNPPLVGGTTAGTYSFTVTATGNDAAKTTATATFTVVVS